MRLCDQAAEFFAQLRALRPHDCMPLTAVALALGLSPQELWEFSQHCSVQPLPGDTKGPVVLTPLTALLNREQIRVLIRLVDTPEAWAVRQSFSVALAATRRARAIVIAN